ncbi:alpha/beta hydrolase [Streptomyces paludis]|uniref:Alpha/beta hydrolase n=1 Tax=Streptomyces paludis TaxID=2282738 RepID=A0A345HVY7_9ACTN|nr:alpha/beta hydrolase [Streptomyces paludis]AXG80861.1 alpha/beta hydrolase [Streptomyces paludis]
MTTGRRGPSASSAVAARVRPPFDPELGAALAALGDRSKERLTSENLAAHRRRDAASRPLPTLTELRADGRFAVEELSVPGAAGGPDVTLVYARPAAATGPLPVLYYLHGGGMIMGNARSVLPRILRDWSAPLNLAVLSVEYRLAPETRYPGPLEDCHTGLVWTAAHADGLGIDSERVVVGGKSAGGGLAAALTLLNRDRGDGPTPIGQLLLCPMLDDRLRTPSALQMTGAGLWDRSSTAVAWQAYLGDRYGAPDLPPYAAPARATDLSGLPPTYLDVGSAETFRDENIAYAQGIWRDGGHAELHVWPGAFHGFDSVAPTAVLSREARHTRTQWLSRVLDTHAGKDTSGSTAHPLPASYPSLPGQVPGGHPDQLVNGSSPGK